MNKHTYCSQMWDKLHHLMQKKDISKPILLTNQIINTHNHRKVVVMHLMYEMIESEHKQSKIHKINIH